MKPLWIATALVSSTWGALGGAASAQQAPSSTSGASIELQNPGFEGEFKSVDSQSDAPNAMAKISGQVATGWGDNSNWAPVSVAYARDTTNPHRGEASQRVEVSRVDGGAVQFVQGVPLKKGRVYEARAWLRGRPGQSVSFSLRKAGAPYTEYSNVRVSLAAEWKEMRVLAPATDDGEAFLMIRSVEPQVFWVDDASLSDVTDARSYVSLIAGNQIANGSF